MPKIPFIILLLLTTGFSFAQSDSVQFDRNFVLSEGIYLNYFDFRTNQPISKEVIKSKEDKTQLDFLGKTIDKSGYIAFSFEGITHIINTDSIWGYCQNNTIYINYAHNFCRVPVFGNISHFIATVEVIVNNNFYGGPYYSSYGMNASGMPLKTKEIRQFMLDFYSGQIVEFDLDNMLIILSRDKKLYDEFTALKRRKQKDMMGLYIRKYNEAHPISYPKIR